MLVAIVTTLEPKPYPLNHCAERAFLVECRKFANFFTNQSGSKRNDMVAKTFVRQPFAPTLPIWDSWDDHINEHLMHLSYARVDNKTPWDGSANEPICNELMAIWPEFLNRLKPLYEPEFQKQLRSRGL
jgi:hypothetical protein